jgi:hypothetical protein
MGNMVEVETSRGKTLVQDLGTYLLSTEVAPLINTIRQTGMKDDIKNMTPDELKAHYGTDKPTDEQILADMDIDISVLGELAYKLLPLGVVEPKVVIGFLDEENEIGAVLKWATADANVSITDMEALFNGIITASGLDKDAGKSFRGSLCHTPE